MIGYILPFLDLVWCFTFCSENTFQESTCVLFPLLTGSTWYHHRKYSASLKVHQLHTEAETTLYWKTTYNWLCTYKNRINWDTFGITLTLNHHLVHLQLISHKQYLTQKVQWALYLKVSSQNPHLADCIALLH